MMDSPQKNIDKGLMQELECPVCMEYMVPPITMCENGHNICPSCKPKLKKCPTCNKPFLQVRNLALESLSRQAVDQSIQNQPVSLPENHKCPFARISNEECVWSGRLSEIKDHIKKDHNNGKDTHEANGTFNIILTSLSSTQHYRKAVFTLGELFYIFWIIQDNKFYCAVLYVGDDEDVSKFKYRFSISADSGTKNISMTFPTQSILDDLEDVLQPAECILIPFSIVDKFLNENKFLICEFEIQSADSCSNSAEIASEATSYLSDPESNEAADHDFPSRHGRSRRHRKWQKHDKSRKHELPDELSCSMKSFRCSHGKRFKHCKLCKYVNFVQNVRASLDTASATGHQPGLSQPGTNFHRPQSPFSPRSHQNAPPHFGPHAPPHFGPHAPPHFGSGWHHTNPQHSNAGYYGSVPSINTGPPAPAGESRYRTLPTGSSAASHYGTLPTASTSASHHGTLPTAGSAAYGGFQPPANCYCEPSMSYVPNTPAEKCNMGFKTTPSAPDEKSLYPKLSEHFETDFPSVKKSYSEKSESISTDNFPDKKSRSNTTSEATWLCKLCGQLAPKEPSDTVLNTTSNPPSGDQWVCKMCGQLRP